MHTDQRQCPLYANFLIFSNDNDAVLIQDADRRFNIAPRQQRSLIENFPELFVDDLIVKLCKSELPDFAAFITQYKYDSLKAQTTRMTDAKQQMIKANQDASDEYCDALRDGDLDFFLPILDLPPFGLGQDHIASAQSVLRNILASYTVGSEIPMWTSELRAMYNVMIAPCDKDIVFGKILAKRGIVMGRVRKYSRQARGLTMVWKIESDIDELRKLYLEDNIVPVSKNFKSG